MTAALKVTGPAIVIRAGRFGFGYRIVLCCVPKPPRGAGSLRRAQALADAYRKQLAKLPVVVEDKQARDGNSNVDVRKG